MNPWHVALASSRRFSQAVTALGEIVEEVFAPTRTSVTSFVVN
jgi:hypothetical protein